MKQTQTAQASSLLNVARNLGGTLGISMSQLLFATGLQKHQSELVQTLNPLNPNYNDWLAKASGAFGSGGDVTTSLAVLYSQVQRQAAMLAFLDVFRTLMVVVLVVAPVVLFMRPGKPGNAPQGAH